MQKIRERKHPYFLNLCLAIDQVFSALCGYDADCTYSAALGEKMIELKVQKLPWTNPLEAFLQRRLDAIEEDHCRKAYHHEIRLDDFLREFDHG